MAIYIQPAGARFKKNTLLINLSDSLFLVNDDTIVGGHDVALIFKEYSIYIELDPGLKFGVIEHSTGEFYGPYYEPIRLVQKHLFGVYDNLLSFLNNNIYYDDTRGEHLFTFNDFIYYRGSYDLGENLPKMARSLKAHLPRIDRRFEFALDAKTYFSDGAIEVFLNRLNVMYNRDNFTEKYVESTTYSAGAISRASGTAIEQANGNRFFVLNASNRRHAAYVIPNIYTDKFIPISSSGASTDYVYDFYITQQPEVLETNIEEVEEFEDVFDIELTVKEFSYKALTLFEDILLVVFPSDNVRIGYYFIRIFDGTIKIVSFDAFTKEMVIYDEFYTASVNAEMESGSISIVDDILEINYGGIGFQAVGTPSVKISTAMYSWATYPQVNQVRNEDGNIYSFQFAKNLLRNIFSGV